MPLTLPKAQKADILGSLQRYLSTELDHELGDIQANHLLDYILKEIAPFAYNQGIEDAKAFLTTKLEDLSGTCFAEGLPTGTPPPPAPAKSAASPEIPDVQQPLQFLLRPSKFSERRMAALLCGHPHTDLFAPTGEPKSMSENFPG